MDETCNTKAIWLPFDQKKNLVEKIAISAENVKKIMQKDEYSFFGLVGKTIEIFYHS